MEQQNKQTLIHFYVVQLGSAAGVLEKQDENTGPRHYDPIKM